MQHHSLKTDHRPKYRLAGAVCAALFTLGGAVALATPTSAAQASWTRTQGSSCTSQSTHFSFNRHVGSTCYTNHTYDADSDLRNTGDTFLDNYYVGSLDGNSPNTDNLYNRWTVTARVCRYTNYVGARHTLDSGQSLNIGGTTGLRSLRASACS